MVTRVRRWLGSLVPAIVILGTLAAAACGGGDPEELTIPVKVTSGKLVTGTVQVKHNDMVTLKIESDTPGEFHLHGYDIPLEVLSGETNELYFLADVEGRFPITFHETAEDEHGELFQSGLLEPGDTFSFVVRDDMESMAIRFHSHLHPEAAGSLIVDPDGGATGTANIEIEDMSVHPHETVVQPGTTIIWTNNDSVTQTVHSGLHESVQADAGHEEEHHSEEVEVEIGVLEVRPR